MKNICTICMRGGSKGVPNKNLRKLNGKPLMAYTIEQAIESNLFEQVVVSTDSNEIAETARKYGAEAWFLRPEELATDDAAKIPVIRHAMIQAEEHFGDKFDILVDLDATSPLRLTEDIAGAYEKFIREDSDILITACKARNNPYFNMVEKIDGRIQKVKQLNSPPVRRQDAPEVYDMNASIYIWKRETLLHCDTLFVEKTSLYVMPEERSFDIDTELDWSIVEYLKRQKTMIDYPDKFRLDGKTAFVAGGLGLIGKEVAIAYAASGAETIVLDINKSQGELFEREMRSKEFDIGFECFNCSDLENLENNFNKLFEEF